MSTLWVLIVSINLSRISVLCLTPDEIEAQKSGWNIDPNTQYHIQTDEGPERYFRYQTLNGQFRKEKRLEDGTVVGTEGWLDPLGYLRIKDYIADREGFRILKSKIVYVGKDRPIDDAVTISRRVPAQSGVLARPRRPPNPFRQPAVQEFSGNSIESNTIKPYRGYPSSDATRRYISPSTTSAYPRSSYFSTTIRPIAIINDRPKPVVGNYMYSRQRPYRAYRKSYTRPVASPNTEVQPPKGEFSSGETDVVRVTPASTYGSYRPDSRRYRAALASGRFNSSSTRPTSRRSFRASDRNNNQARSTVQSSSSSSTPRVRQARIPQTSPSTQEFPAYDGTHTSADGFQYYLKTHYHEEEQKPDQNVGSFGYVDPFGIRRVVYYKADGQNGFVHKKNNRYVGFDATPYDPVPPKTT